MPGPERGPGGPGRIPVLLVPPQPRPAALSAWVGGPSESRAPHPSLLGWGSSRSPCPTPACAPQLCPATAPLADCCGSSLGPPHVHDPSLGALSQGHPLGGVPELWAGGRDRCSLLTRPRLPPVAQGGSSGAARAQWSPCGLSGELELPPCRAGVARVVCCQAGSQGLVAPTLQGCGAHPPALL